MTDTNTALSNDLDGFHEDLSLLCRRLESGYSGQPLVSNLKLEKVKDTQSFIRFSEQYVRYLLVPVELPAIVSAAELVSKNAFRELLALDKQLGSEPLLKVFEEASRTLGRNQLRKLRGLKDVRILSRYRSAVMDGNAHGWHILVYGAVLHMFSMPLRQGLAKYQQQVLSSFAQSACQSLQWSESEWNKVSQFIRQIPVPSLESICPEEQSSVLPFIIV